MPIIQAIKQTPLWCWPLLLIVASMLTPIGTIIASLFELSHTSSGTWQHLVDTVLAEYISNSLLLMLGVSVGVLSLGVSSAWLIARYTFIGSRFFQWLLVLPLAMPAYIIAYTYTGMLDYSGPVQSAIRASFGFSYGEYYFPEIKSLGGAICMMSLVLYPYVYLLTRTAFENQSHSIREASLSLGLNEAKTFWHISLPIARPAIIAGLALALMETLADYGTVQYFGVSVFSTGIFRTWFGLGDASAAAQLSSLLLVFVVILLSAEQYSRRKLSYQQSLNKLTQKKKLNKSASLFAASFCTLIILLGFLLPFIQLAYWTLFQATNQWNHAFFELAFNSIKLASITAVLAVSLALLLAYMKRLIPNRLNQAAISLASLGYALPGTVIAVGIMTPFAALDHRIHNFMQSFGIQTGLIFSGSLVIVIFAYLIRFMAVSLGNIQSNMNQISPHIDEAARNLKQTPAKLIWHIHMPILRTSLFASALLVFVDTLKELPATLALRPFNFNTLAVRAYELANDEQLANAAPAIITIVIVGLIPVIWLNAFMNKKNHA